MSVGGVALVDRLIVEGTSWAQLVVAESLGIILMIPIGVVLGGWISRYVRDDTARRAVIVIAFAGAALAVAHGVLSMLQAD